MDTNTTNPNPAEVTNEVEQAPIPQFPIVRGNPETSWDIVLDSKSRGLNKGKPYLRPADITEENLRTAITWFTPKMVCAILNAKAALMGSNITEQATGDDGILNVEEAKRYFADFSTRGESKADLEKRQLEVTLEMKNVSRDTSISIEEKIKRIGELGDEISKLVQAIADKSRERKPRTATATDAEATPES